MVDLDSPVLTLGALFLAGNSADGRDLTGGEGGVGLLAGGFSSASAQTAVTEIRNAAGIDSSSLSDELAQALLGAGVSLAGRRLDGIPTRITNPMARGIHYNVAHQAFEEAGFTLAEFMDDNGNGNGSSTQAVTSTRSRSTSQGIHNTRRNGGDMEVY